MHNVKMHLDLASNGIMRCNGGRQQVKAWFAEWSLLLFQGCDADDDVVCNE